MKKIAKKMSLILAMLLITVMSLVSVFSVAAAGAPENTYGIPDWLWNQVPQEYKEKLVDLLPEDFTLPEDIEIPDLPDDFQLPEDFVFPELPENKDDFNVDNYVKELTDEVKKQFSDTYEADRQYYRIAYNSGVFQFTIKDEFSRPENGFKSLLLDVYTDAVKALTAASVENRFTLFAALQNGIDSAALKEVFNSVKTIKIDDLTVYDGSFRTDSLKQLIKRLPMPSELATYTDAQFANLLSFNVAIETLDKGNLNVNVNLGFQFANANNYNRLRRIAQIVADYVTVGHTDGVYSVSVTVPQAFTRILNKAINTNKLTDSQKLKIFAALDKNVNEFAEYAKTVTFDKVYNFLEKIDIVGCIDNTRLGKYFPDGLTNEKILAAFKKIEPYFEKIKSAAIDLVTYLPQKLQSKTMMDFYRGNGEFSVARYDYELVIESWLYKLQNKGLAVTDYIKSTYSDERILKWNARLEKLLNKLPSLSVFFNKESYTVSAKASATLTDVYKVTYSDGKNVIKQGLLPVGADLRFFANMTAFEGGVVIDWIDENGNSVYEMPARDIEVRVVYDAGFTLEKSEDINCDYDGETKQLKVVATEHSTYAKTYAYAWYKVVGETRVAIEGATSDSLDVMTVADSGKYVCVVTSGDLSKEVEFTVAIAKAKVDMTDAKWSYTAPFTYDGAVKTVSLVNAPAQVEISGTLSATNVGVYTATFALKDSANYELINLGSLTDTIEWKIEKAKVDMTGVKWSYTAPFAYDGAVKTVSLVNAPAQVEISGTLSATKVGTYTATFALKDSANYEFINLGALASSLEWKIEKGKVNMAGVKWSYTAPFTYDGSVKTVSLVNAPAQVEISGTLSATNVGTYTATFALKDSASYEFINLGALASSLEWKIEKGKVNMAGVKWSYTAPFTYDGTAKTVSLVNAPAQVEINGTFSATDAGTYTATFALKDSVNYEFINLGALASSLEWKIEKADIDMSAVANSFVDSEFVYDGKPHTLTVDSKLLPEGVTVKEYTGKAVVNVSDSPKTITVVFALTEAKAKNYNVPASISAVVTVVAKEIGITWQNLEFTYDGTAHVPTAIATGLVGNDTCGIAVTGASKEIGTHTATAVSVDNANYKLPANVTVTFEIKAQQVIEEPVTKIDTATGIVVKSSELDNEMLMIVTDVTKENKDVDVSKLASEGKKASIVNVYDITFKKNGNVCELKDGSYEVTLPIPSADGKVYKIVSIDKDGNVSEIDCVVSADGKSVKFTVNNLKDKYSIVEISDKQSGLVENAGLVVGIGCGVIVLFSAAALYVVVFRKKKRM